MITRRHFVRTGAVASCAAVVPAYARPGVSTGPLSFHEVIPTCDPMAGPDDPVLRELAMRALDAARAAGATYADVRFTSERTQNIGLKSPVRERGRVYVGVRALIGGFWGFAASADCTADVVTRLAREAVEQAKVNDWGTTRVVTLDDAPPTATGTWRTPVERDPFAVSVEEKIDFLVNASDTPQLLRMPSTNLTMQLEFRRQEKVFASTTGAYLTQTLLWTGPVDASFELRDSATSQKISISRPAIALQSGGYEVVTAAGIPERFANWVEDARRLLSWRFSQIGKYDFVLDAHTTAALIRSTVGYATECDRVRGFEANAGGTSYLSEEMLGTAIAAPDITITGSRSSQGGPARVAWDDDGVAPQAFDIVRDGVLMDFATTREHASSLTSWYAKHGKPARSHGCATACDASEVPLVTPPDLTLAPAAQDVTFAQLVADTRNGIAVLHGDCVTDRQQRTGQGGGELFEIRNGALGKYLGQSAAFLFQATEFWKNIIARGGPSSVVSCGFTSSKGQPAQAAFHGITAVPIKVHDLTLIDPWQF